MLAMMHPMPTLFDAMLSDVVFNDPLVCRSTARLGLCASRATPQVLEKEKEYTITVSVPGIRSEDLRVSVDEGALNIRGETKTNAHTHFANWTTRLPKDADAEKSTASHVDGLLKVTIPKKEVAKMAIALLPDGETTPDDDDDADFYTMRLNCAGIAKADLGLTIEDDLLTVSGETKSRGIQLPTRLYRLPEDADGDKACASYIDGILTIAVPKKAIALPKRIQITLNAECSAENKSADEKDAAMEAQDDEEAEMV